MSRRVPALTVNTGNSGGLDIDSACLCSGMGTTSRPAAMSGEAMFSWVMWLHGLKKGVI